MAESVDAADFAGMLSALQETAGVEPLKFGETSRVKPVAIPSQAPLLFGDGEGVETRRAGPKAASAAMVKG